MTDVLGGSVQSMHTNELVPGDYRTHITIQGFDERRIHGWKPVLLNPKRGFLMEKGAKRRWKALANISESKILEYEARLEAAREEGLQRGHQVHVVEMAESVDDAEGNELEARRPSIQARPSDNAMSWYKAFSRGLVESSDDDIGMETYDGDEDDFDALRSSASGMSEEESELIAPAPIQTGGGMVVGDSQQTATGGFRDELAEFAAQFAQEQAAKQAAAEAALGGVTAEKASVGTLKSQTKPLEKRQKKKTTKVKRDYYGEARRKWEAGYKKMERVCWCRGVYFVPLLVLVSSTVALMAMLLDFLPAIGTNALVALGGLTNSTLVNFLLFLTFMGGFTFAAVMLTVHVFPVIAGSGIPEIRSILSGSLLPQYLRTLVLPVKLLGVMLMVSSGFWVGKEGPAVHLACLVGVFYVRMLPIFQTVRDNRTLYRWLLTSCSALGPAGVFGSPIGGVLFSIEATASYFSVTELFFSFIAAVPAALVVRVLLGVYLTGNPAFAPITQLQSSQILVPHAGEFFWAMLMAVILGLVGPLFIELSSQTTKLRRFVFQKSKFWGNQLIYYLVILLLSAVLFFPGFIGEFMSLNPLRVLIALTKEDRTLLELDGWTKFDIRGTLTIFFLVKTTMLAFVIGLPAPTGLFLPTLAQGAAFGRLWGIFLVNFTGENFVSDGINPWGMAAIGAACLGTSVTHTVSTAVILMEVIGTTHLLIPILCGTVVSFIVSRTVTSKVGIYERISFDRRLPFLFELPISMYPIRAREMMVPIDFSQPTEGRAKCMVNNSTLGNIDELLDHDFNPSAVFPVVDSYKTQMLIGFISAMDLLKYRMNILKKLEGISAMSRIPKAALHLSSMNLLNMGETEQLEEGLDVNSLRRSRHKARSILQQVQESVDPLKVTKVHITVSPSSPISFIHQLMSLNGPKADVIPVCDKGRLLGLIFRGDVAKSLVPERYKPKDAPATLNSRPSSPPPPGSPPAGGPRRKSMAEGLSNLRRSFSRKPDVTYSAPEVEFGGMKLNNSTLLHRRGTPTSPIPESKRVASLRSKPRSGAAEETGSVKDDPKQEVVSGGAVQEESSPSVAVVEDEVANDKVASAEAAILMELGSAMSAESSLPAGEPARDGHSITSLLLEPPAATPDSGTADQVEDEESHIVASSILAEQAVMEIPDDSAPATPAKDKGEAVSKRDSSSDNEEGGFVPIVPIEHFYSSENQSTSPRRRTLDGAKSPTKEPVADDLLLPLVPVPEDEDEAHMESSSSSPPPEKVLEALLDNHEPEEEMQVVVDSVDRPTRDESNGSTIEGDFEASVVSLGI